MALNRPIAVFKASTKISKFIFEVRALEVNVLDHPEHFEAIIPTPEDVSINVDTLEVQQAKVVARKRGAAALRNIDLIVSFIITKMGKEWKGVTAIIILMLFCLLEVAIMVVLVLSWQKLK